MDTISKDFLKFYENSWFISRQLGETLSIVWGVYNIHDVTDILLWWILKNQLPEGGSVNSLLYFAIIQVRFNCRSQSTCLKDILNFFLSSLETKWTSYIARYSSVIGAWGSFPGKCFEISTSLLRSERLRAAEAWN